MGISEKIIEKLVDGLISLVTKKHKDDVLLVEDVQKMVDSIHKYYLECYKKYDGILANETYASITPHPVFAEIANDSIFGSLDRDKINGITQYQTSNAEVDEYLARVKSYMIWSNTPIADPIRGTSYRVRLMELVREAFDPGILPDMEAIARAKWARRCITDAVEHHRRQFEKVIASYVAAKRSLI